LKHWESHYVEDRKQKSWINTWDKLLAKGSQKPTSEKYPGGGGKKSEWGQPGAQKSYCGKGERKRASILKINRVLLIVHGRPEGGNNKEKGGAIENEGKP